LREKHDSVNCEIVMTETLTWMDTKWIVSCLCCLYCQCV